MTRLTLALAVFALLMLAAVVGWLCCWLWSRPARRATGSEARIAQLAAQLHAAEVSCAAATRRAADAEAALATARAAADAAAAQDLAECRAELAATMDALGAARREAAERRVGTQGRPERASSDQAASPQPAAADGPQRR